MFYYEPPTDEIYDEMKTACILLWTAITSDDSYRKEKLDRLYRMDNVSDNFMVMFAMFDHINQARLASMLPHDVKRAIYTRAISGGTPPEYLTMLVE